MSQDEIKRQEISDEPSMSFFSRIFGALFFPSKTFPHLNRRPDWLGAMVVIIIFSLCMSLLYAQKTDLIRITRQQLEQSGRIDELTEEQRQRAVEISSKIQRYVLLVGAIFFTPLTFLIIAGIMHLIFSLLQAGTTFKKVFSVVSYSYLPMVFSALIGIILLLGRKVNVVPIQDLVKSNLSVLLVQEESSKFLWNLASSIDFFSLWSVVLLCIGMTAISKISLKNSSLIVGSLWIVWVVIIAFLRSLTG